MVELVGDVKHGEPLLAQLQLRKNIKVVGVPPRPFLGARCQMAIDKTQRGAAKKERHAHRAFVAQRIGNALRTHKEVRKCCSKVLGAVQSKA